MLIDDANIVLEVIPAASVPSPPASKVVLFLDSTNSNRLSLKDSTGNVIDLAQLRLRKFSVVKLH